MKERLKIMGSSGSPVLAIIWLILAVLCFLYGVIVQSVGSGTGFFVAWWGLGFIFVLFAVIAYWHLWMCIPGLLRKGILLVIAIGMASLLIIEGGILKDYHCQGEKNLDYLIVLGAQMRAKGPSTVLKLRLDKAIDYLNENPDTICIVTGAQGYNEPCTEAEGMATYLEKKGIDSSRIILEDASHTTEENMKNSRKLIEKRELENFNSRNLAEKTDGGQSNSSSANEREVSIGILTNNFHMHRALQIARKTGLKNYCGISAPTTKLFLPNNLFREYFAEIKFILLSLHS